MDKETREFLETMQKGIEEFKNEMQEFRKETNTRFDGVEDRFHGLEGQVKELKTGQEKLEIGQEKLGKGQKEIKTLIEELDPKNANRHLELKESIDGLRKDLTNVEIITSSNWNEIAKLKNVK